MGALEKPEPAKSSLAIVLTVVLASAFCTELIGIHALFGAFLAGVIMPRAGGFREKLIVRVENISSVLLLPVFFVFTGLRLKSVFSYSQRLGDLQRHHCRGDRGKIGRQRDRCSHYRHGLAPAPGSWARS